MSWLHWFDNAPLVGFYALGLVAIMASLRVIVLANPVHAILSMIVSLLALAGIFFIVGAPFAGALQVIVYAGAILVLFVFVIMMLNIGIKNDERESRWLSGEVWAVPTGLTLIIAVVLYAMIAMGHGDSSSSAVASHAAGVANAAMPMMGTETVSAKQVGIALFSEYLMLVEVAAMLLLAALVAAYHLGKKALDDENVSHSSQGVQKGVILENANLENANLENVNPVAAYQYHPVNAQEFITQAPATTSITSAGSKPNTLNKEGR